ncbi:cytochrome b562 [Vibrio sp. ZSDE26]|uniref:Cytochrome b562 n=1 Tax=Vibrio amylolyticus TaxID=2847292 RepID=A0A9X1XI86_9VIBR|nr:cytochrome b562 [Vibrio amylolyticus]MCK6263697.1 cytochrome b562 [Vibrio amylolyticus]
MKKTLPILLGLALSSVTLSTNVMAEDFDMTQTMKKMGFEFRQAAKAEDIETMQEAMTNLSALIQRSKQAEHPEEREELYMEGFKKLTLAIDNVEEQLENGELELAQEALREVDDLRIEFHDRRNPSIWKRLFG